MEEAISPQNTNPPRENSLEYYQYLRERVSKSPLSTSSNPYFPELSKEKKEE